MGCTNLIAMSLMVVAVSFVSGKIQLGSEFTCMGCQLTVKELAGKLRFKTSEPIDKRVKQLLTEVCKEDHFKTTEYSAKIMNNACKDLIKTHGKDLREALVEYYSSKNQHTVSYIDVVSRICNDKIPACTKLEKENKYGKKTGDIVYSAEKDTFEIIPGDNVKYAMPMREMHEEL